MTIKVSAAKVADFKAVFQTASDKPNTLSVTGWEGKSNDFPLGSWTFQFPNDALDPEILNGLRRNYGEWLHGGR